MVFLKEMFDKVDFENYQHMTNGSMTFGRKPFGRNDVWSNATFGRYDVLPTTTFGRLRQLVENSSNYVEI